MERKPWQGDDMGQHKHGKEMERCQLLVIILIAAAAVLMGAVAGRATLLHSEAAAADHEFIAEEITAQTDQARSWVAVFQEYAYALRYAQYVEYAEVLTEEQAQSLEGGAASSEVAGSLQEEAALYDELAQGARRSFQAGQLYVIGPPGQRNYVYDVKARHHQETVEALAAGHLEPEERKSHADNLHHKTTSVWLLLIPIGAAFLFYTMAQYALYEARGLGSGPRPALAVVFRAAVYLLIGLGVIAILTSLVMWIQIEL
jgi:uncharacterized membrane protein YidH (DUF202 family)